jgi:hypothetical protein
MKSKTARGSRRRAIARRSSIDQARLIAALIRL